MDGAGESAMQRSFDTSVLIVGAGPVGLTLAMDLASRGVAAKNRGTGMAAEYRNDVVNCVSALGAELSRIKLPSRAGRVRGEKGDDGHWLCAEWGHRINQLH